MSIFGTPLGWIMKFLYWFIPNYGLALVVFTVLVRLAVFPLNIKQQKMTAKMSLFQPKLQKLQKQYGKNKEKYQEEMMKLYQQEGYNPMSSCLPMLLQMVVLFGIIDVVYKPLKHILSVSSDTINAAAKILTEAGVKKSSYMELPIINAIQNGKVGDIAIDPALFNDIFSADVLDRIKHFDLNFLGISLGQNPSWTWPIMLLPLISGATSLIVSFISIHYQKKNATTEQSGMGMMKGMMYIMPIFSTWIAFTLPSGVGLYWIVSNLFSMAQTVILNKVYSPEKMKAQVAKEQAARKKKKPSQFQQALKDEIDRRNGQAPAPKKPEEQPTPEGLTPNQAIALARKRMAEKYGDEYND